MGYTVTRMYRRVGEGLVHCFNIESSRPLSAEETQTLRLLLADGFVADTVSLEPLLVGKRVVEVGPRLNFATAWSSNMVSICGAVGLTCITRIERSRRYQVPRDEAIDTFVVGHHDRMTECLYPEPLTSFATGVTPEAVYEVDMLTKGPDALLDIPGISMDEWDRNFYYDYFVREHGRNPTIVEIMDLNNANSEHSRHGFFKGLQILDGVPQKKTLFQMVTDTLDKNPRGSVIAFKDNSSALQGHEIPVLQAGKPGSPSPLVERTITAHALLTAETHNFPTGVAPFPGAETGTGGRLRDVLATGQGASVLAGTAGYCVANLHIPGYPLTWEEKYPCPKNLASALDIEIEASNGASDYGNKFGEPLIQGFTRSFDLHQADGQRWGFLKPIMFTGGIGQIDARHTEKKPAEKGMRIVQVGGPAYRVGFGGGAASSMMQGENISDLDFDAVQRGDAEMEQKMTRVIRACNEMGDRTLVQVIHDQGAGGPANVLKELVEASGGRVEIRNIRVGDPTMSVLEIYVAEYQERCGFLIRPENMKQFKALCKREKVHCEDLGEVTGDLRFVLHDRDSATTPVDISIDRLLGSLPQKEFIDTRQPSPAIPLQLPDDFSMRGALHDVLRLVSVGSKRFLTNKVDRAVTGLVGQQQCCGPLQLPLADVCVVAQSYLGRTGIASAIGEQPIKMLLDPAAGARLAVGEALTNLVWAKIDDLDQVKCSANWMWAPKLPGEGAALYDAVSAMAEVMIPLGIAVDGGKDSLSMATMVGEETVKSPRQLVISLYAAMADLTCKVTPDLKEPGSTLIFIDLGAGKNRMGGSALAHTHKQLGDASPDLDDPALLRRTFLAVQELLADGLVLAGHDRSDGGLLTTVLEMAFGGNCGLELTVAGDTLPVLFSEELGLVLEVHSAHADDIRERLGRTGVPCSILGKSLSEPRIILRHDGNGVLLDEDMRLLRQWWEETSYQLERLQMNPDCADQERAAIFDRPGPTYRLPFTPRSTEPNILSAAERPLVAVLRDEGSNSDREMSAAFHAAGFEAWDICMNDLLEERIDLGRFSGLAAVGGFSYADVPESAKGWAATIRFNTRLQQMFTAFYHRPDTFTLGICNGCQLFALLGWVPWEGIDAEHQPRFVRNLSGRFESRWSTVRINPSPAIMLKGMEGLVFGIHVDHGEGRLIFPDPAIQQRLVTQQLTPITFVDDQGEPTETYPFNPNGSPGGIAGLCSADGRHLAMMPHPERAFLPWQAHWLPGEMRQLQVSPWLRMFQNAHTWCTQSVH
ncbi:MAG: phosphoribosylformylglycinamidine synthase [Desulfobulbus propionicus]|nr:MAG: phosphoribosylformylglycinamidine synthase [Desulfobulbus propionicus]